MGTYTKWDPIAESTPGTEPMRSRPKGDGDNPGAEPDALILDWTPHLSADGKSKAFNACKCGCREKVVSEFRQGHDARLKGRLQRAHVAGVEVAIIEGELLIYTDAKKLATERGWDRFIAAAEVGAEKERRQALTARQPRQSKGSGTSSLDLLNKMKQASQILKEAGRYKGDDKIVITHDNVDSILDGTHPDLAAPYVGKPVTITIRGKAVEAMITEIDGDRARVAYRNAKGEQARKVVELASLTSAG